MKKEWFHFHIAPSFSTDAWRGDHRIIPHAPHSLSLYRVATSPDSCFWFTMVQVPPPQLMPISHHPKQNQAEGGTSEFKVNPNQLPNQMAHPVSLLLPLSPIWRYPAGRPQRHKRVVRAASSVLRRVSGGISCRKKARGHFPKSAAPFRLE